MKRATHAELKRQVDAAHASEKGHLNRLQTFEETVEGKVFIEAVSLLQEDLDQDHRRSLDALQKNIERRYNYYKASYENARKKRLGLEVLYKLALEDAARAGG